MADDITPAIGLIQQLMQQYVQGTPTSPQFGEAAPAPAPTASVPGSTRSPMPERVPMPEQPSQPGFDWKGALLSALAGLAGTGGPYSQWRPDVGLAAASKVGEGRAQRRDRAQLAEAETRAQPLTAAGQHDDAIAYLTKFATQLRDPKLRDDVEKTMIAPLRKRAESRSIQQVLEESEGDAGRIAQHPAFQGLAPERQTAVFALADKIAGRREAVAFQRSLANNRGDIGAVIDDFAAGRIPVRDPKTFMEAMKPYLPKIEVDSASGIMYRTSPMTGQAEIIRVLPRFESQAPGATPTMREWDEKTRTFKTAPIGKAAVAEPTPVQMVNAWSSDMRDVLPTIPGGHDLYEVAKGVRAGDPHALAIYREATRRVAGMKAQERAMNVANAIEIKRESEADDRYDPKGLHVYDQTTGQPVTITNKMARDPKNFYGIPGGKGTFVELTDSDVQSLQRTKMALASANSIKQLLGEVGLGVKPGENLTKGAMLTLKKRMGQLPILSVINQLEAEMAVEVANVLTGSVRTPIAVFQQILANLPNNFTSLQQSLAEVDTVIAQMHQRRDGLLKRPVPDVLTIPGFTGTRPKAAY